MDRVVLFIALAPLVPFAASAHGFGQKIDLPIPLYLYLFGGGGVVALSFVLLGLGLDKWTKRADTYPTLNLTAYTWFRMLLSPVIISGIKLLFVAFLLLSVAAGFIGVSNPAFNILPTTVWVLFGVGITFVSAILGNIWNVINPFKTLYEYLESFLVRLNGATVRVIAWPAWLGVWPATGLFFLYRWIENVDINAAMPASLALVITLYGIITLAGMHLFGKNVWLRMGDPFSVFFEFLSRFSLIETRETDGKTEIHLRPLAVGLLRGEALSVSETCFILLMLSTVAADGILTTSFFTNIFVKLVTLGIPWSVAKTLGLLGLFAVFALTFGAFSYLTRLIVPKVSNTLDVGRSFIVSLLPISIAYEFAHFVSLLAIEGQRIVYLISDPFGKGWNLFGTATYEINYTILDLKMLWHFQVGFIVLGHVIAVYIAHAIAVRVFKNRQNALISQYPMLVLMIFYSMLSLWIMGQPIVAVE